MKHPLVALEERGAQALTSGDAAEFYRTYLADDAQREEKSRPRIARIDGFN